jgi:O-antigen ligase
MTEATRTPFAAAFRVDGRATLFVVILLLALVSLAPFSDLSTVDSAELGEGKDIWTYAAFAILAATAGMAVWRSDRPAIQSLQNPSYLALAAWIGVSCLTSQDPTTSIKRAAMLSFVVICAGSLFLLPRDRSQLARLLSFTALVVVGLSYFGVIFLPQYAIHQAMDLTEPLLAGDWRGSFAHKNLASAVFSVLAFVGLFVGSERRFEGLLIFVLAILFVVASGGKSSLGICVVTIMVSYLAARTQNIALWLALVFSPLALLNLLGVGSVVWPSLSELSAALPLDNSFTGRTDVWSFALPKAGDALLVGHGFLAFWNTDALRYGMEQTTTWAGFAAHAHNGYLDAVLSMGLPGLFLTIVAFVVKPASDIRRVLARSHEPALCLLFMQIWLFSLYLNALESFFFDRASPSWIAFLFAVFGAHYLARFRIVDWSGNWLGESRRTSV